MVAGILISLPGERQVPQSTSDRLHVCQPVSPLLINISMICTKYTWRKCKKSSYSVLCSYRNVFLLLWRIARGEPVLREAPRPGHLPLHDGQRRGALLHGMNGCQIWPFYGQNTLLKVHQLKFYNWGLTGVEVLPNIKIWRLAPNFDIWKNFNSM